MNTWHMWYFSVPTDNIWVPAWIYQIKIWCIIIETINIPARIPSRIYPSGLGSLTSQESRHVPSFLSFSISTVFHVVITTLSLSLSLSLCVCVCMCVLRQVTQTKLHPTQKPIPVSPRTLDTFPQITTPYSLPLPNVHIPPPLPYLHVYLSGNDMIGGGPTSTLNLTTITRNTPNLHPSIFYAPPYFLFFIFIFLLVPIFTNNYTQKKLEENENEFK